MTLIYRHQEVCDDHSIFSSFPSGPEGHWKHGGIAGVFRYGGNRPTATGLKNSCSKGFSYPHVNQPSVTSTRRNF